MYLAVDRSGWMMSNVLTPYVILISVNVLTVVGAYMTATIMRTST